MSAKIIARQIDGGLWQWRTANNINWVEDTYYTGDNDALIKALPDSNTPISMIISGAQAVSLVVPVTANEKRHMAKLLPYELEDRLIDSVEDLHFTFNVIGEESASVLYTHVDGLSQNLEQFTAQNCEVYDCLPDYLSLKLEEGGATIVLEGGNLIAKLGEGTGFSLEWPMANGVLTAELASQDYTGTINLVAETEAQLQALQESLPESLLEMDGPPIEKHIGNFWQWVELEKRSPLNLRSGPFARQLPIKRWMELWKKPAIVLGVAFLIGAVVNFGEYLQAKSEANAIRAEIEAIYLSVVPNGRLGDEEGQLRSRLRRAGGSITSEPTNFITLVNGLASALAEQQNVNLANFRYSGDQKTLQVSLAIPSLEALTNFRELLGKKGLDTSSPNSTESSGSYTARMKITEKQP